MRNDGSSRGPTFIDVLITAILLVLAGVVVVPRLSVTTREQNNRVQCSSNLRQVLLAMLLYANQEPRGSAFPRTTYRKDTVDRPVFYTHPRSPVAIGPGGPDANDVTAALFILLRTQDISTNQFVCPSARAIAFVPPKGKSILDYSNFESAKTLSYSFENPYPSQSAILAGFMWNDAMSADAPVIADMNPGSKELLSTRRDAPPAEQRKLNSPSHGFDGQNVGFADGHVAWKTTAWCGRPMSDRTPDNIYTYRRAKNGVIPTQATGIFGPPAGADDSVLLPAWDRKIAFPVIDTK